MPPTEPSPARSGVLVLGRDDVSELLPMGECLTAMLDAFRMLADGSAAVPLRLVTPLPRDAGWLGVMPATLDAPATAAVKAITVVPSNSGTALDSHQGAVLLFDAARGALLAILDAGAITAVRTAAASGLATNLLARSDAGDLALIGAGVQARMHLEAMAAVRSLRRIRLWARARDRAEAFAAEAARAGRAPVPIEVADDPRAAVEGADIVCTVTAAREPVVRGAWLAAGAHVNAVGACVPTHRELDTDAVVRSLLFVDRRESALAEAGDVILPIREGAITERHIAAELGEVLTGAHPGRREDGAITLFKSLGLAIQDLAAARVVHRNAVAAGRGTRVPLGGPR